jgi:hypothetical protein
LNLAFHLNVLKGFIPIFYEYAEGVCNEMEKNNLDGKEFDLLFPLAKLTARSVAGSSEGKLNRPVHRKGL